MKEKTHVWFGGNVVFGGKPFLGGTALVDILPCGTGIKRLRREY